MYAAGFVLFFIATEVGRGVYRPWVYANHIHDYGIADTIGNSLGTLTQIFFMLSLANATRKESYRIVAGITAGYIFYEIVQPWLPRGTFDMGDINATIGAGIAAAIVVALLHRLPLGGVIRPGQKKSSL